MRSCWIRVALNSVIGVLSKRHLEGEEWNPMGRVLA